MTRERAGGADSAGRHAATGRTNACAPLAGVAVLMAAAIALASERLANLGLPSWVVSFVVATAVLLAGSVALGRRFDALVRSSLEDPMTRVGNRRHWETCLHEELDRAVRSEMPLAIVLVDVDNLKTLNDAHGHACGDRALALVAAVLRDTCRSRDVAARLGGDEFAILLPRTRASEARAVAERVRAELAARRARAGAPLEALLTVSIGIADLESVRDARPELLFESADRALYTAKANGRDRVVVKERALVSGIIDLEAHRAKKKGRVSA